MSRECYFTSHKISHIDYKDVALLSQFLNPYGRIKTRRYTGVCAKHQRELARAVKNARFMGLIPYIMK